MNNNCIIRELLDDALEILERMEGINYQTKIGRNTRALLEIVTELSPLIKDDYPTISDILQYSSKNIAYRNRCINAYSFGDLQTSIEILDILYPHHVRKIFISHSSKDAVIINKFKTEILLAGCSLQAEDIFCTLDHSAIKTGDDFRNAIIRNMKECDFILLMISENYKRSEICLNEMGAAWALQGKTVLPFILPSCSFDDMGCLYNVKQGASIIDKTKLDELYEEICETYDLKQNWKHFNQLSDAFINSVNQVNTEKRQ